MLNQQPQNPSLRTKYQIRIKQAASSILLVAIMTVVNILLFVFGADVYFIFTAYIPYVLGIIGVQYIEGVEGYLSKNPGMGIFFLSIAAVITIVYFICFALAKKKNGWLIAGTVLFTVDTLFLLYDMFMSAEPVSFLLDVFIHALILAEMYWGITAIVKLKKLPPEEPVALDNISDGTDSQPGISDEFKN